MLETYQTEIIGVISILVVIVIFIMLKKSKSNQKLEKEVQTKEDTPIQKEEKQELKESKEEQIEKEKDVISTVKKHIDSDILISGTEEGSFGIEEDVQDEYTETEENTTREQTRFKRDVPPHGKIVKNDFKEFAGTKILVAEDNLINQKVISGLLADTGIEITMADDGQDALDILEKNSDFNFILMDAHMPRVDGFEATRIIRRNPNYNHILVIALSGDTASDDLKKMRDAGMEEQLEKPLRMDALYDILYAYSGTTQKEDNDDFIEVIMTKELDGDKGLEVCGGDKSFYDEILGEFVNGYSDSAEKLDNLLQNNQIEQADNFLLDIIGITANIGANNLNKISKNLKESLSNKQNQNSLSLAKEYRQHLTQLLKDIEEYK